MYSLFRQSLIVAILSLVWVPQSFSGEITFSFEYDKSFTDSAGSNLTKAQDDFAYVGNYMKSIIKTSGAYDVTMRFTISGINQSGSSTLGFAGSDYYGFSNSFNKTATQKFAQTGTNPVANGGPVGYSTFNFGKSWGFNGVVSSSEIDFRFVLLHEMTHAMGFIGLIGSSGSTTSASTGFYGYMDQYMYGYNGTSYQPLVQTSGSNLVAMSGASSAVINSVHPVQFRGPNVLAYLGNSTGQDMYTPSTFSSGSSLYHVNIANNLLYYSIGSGTKPFGYSGLHQAILKDLGYTVVPEPATYLLTAISTIVLVSFHKSKMKRRRAETASHAHMAA